MATRKTSNEMRFKVATGDNALDGGTTNPPKDGDPRKFIEGDMIFWNTSGSDKGFYVRNSTVYNPSTTTGSTYWTTVSVGSGGSYTLPISTNGARGGVQIGYAENGKNYPIELSSEKMYVNVPWTDTTYSVTDGGLTQNNFTNTLKSKLDGIAANAEVNVQSDWSAGSGDAQILNKPTIPSGNAIIDWTADQGATNIHSGNYTDTTYTVGDGGLTQKNFTTALNTKLAGIAANAEVNVDTNLGSNATNSALEITSSTGDDVSLPAATTSAWGVMTDEDKTKLDTLKETINLVVTVGSGVYFIDGVKVSSINLQPGFTYKFDQSDGTNNTHPLRLAKEPDAANSSSYTAGVTTAGTPGSAGAFTQIVVNNATPLVLYTYCTNHSGMGQEVVCGAPKYQGGVVDITTSPPPTIMSAHVSNYIFYRAGNDTTNNQTNDVRIDVATQFPKGATISIKSALNGDYSSPVQDTVKVSVYKSSTDLSSTNPFIVINGNANNQSVGSHQNFTIQKGKKLDLFYDGSKFVLVGFFQGA